MARLFFSLLQSLLAALLVAHPSAQSQPTVYQTPAELKQLAARYEGRQWPLARVTTEDRLVFADIVASERALNLKRTKQQEDYEFGLASACFPIPNWPKPPPPPPPPPNPPPKPQVEAKELGGLIATPASKAAQTTRPELLYQRLQAAMEGISINETKRQQLRRILKKEVLVLGPSALREQKLFVTDVFMF